MDHCSHIIISKIRRKLNILKIQFYQNKHRASWEKCKHMKSYETDSSDTKLSMGIRVQSSDLKAHAPEFSSYKYLWRRAKLLLCWSSWFLQQVVCGDSNCDSQCSQASFILFSIKNIQNTCYFGVCFELESQLSVIIMKFWGRWSDSWFFRLRSIPLILELLKVSPASQTFHASWSPENLNSNSSCRNTKRSFLWVSNISP